MSYSLMAFHLHYSNDTNMCQVTECACVKFKFFTTVAIVHYSHLQVAYSLRFSKKISSISISVFNI